jgi:hypothetical protein
MSSNAHDLIHQVSTTTLDSIETLIKTYKQDNTRDDDYGIGYNDAMDTVLRNIAMYRKIVADANAKAKLSE